MICDCSKWMRMYEYYGGKFFFYGIALQLYFKFPLLVFSYVKLIQNNIHHFCLSWGILMKWEKFEFF